MAVELEKKAKELGIRYFLIAYADLFGTMRAKLVPAAAIAQMQKDGAGFAGFASWLDLTPANSDVFALPDPDSLIQLPWKPEVGWLAADLVMDGAPLAQSPRHVLKQAIEAARAAGYRLRHGVECEFFLIAPDGRSLSDAADVQGKPCYDQVALMRRFDVISEICDHMQTLGWGPYQNDHEDANGQFEMNWTYDDALLTADRHAFFKYMVRSVAERHGYRATFMPKPFAQLTGNGCHAHVSLWDKAGKRNLFHDPKGELGIAALGYSFLGGLMAHAPPLTALVAPSVNSYKRLNAAVTASGSTWAPNKATYGGNNRTHMVRIPDAGRFEIRLADGAANPYLLPAAYLAAGLEGIANQRDPGKRLDLNMYTDGHKARGIRTLPLNLLDALRELDRSKVLRSALGAGFVDSFVKLKTAEWNDYMRHLTDWERDNSLDC